MLRLAVGLVISAALIFAGGMVVWLRVNVVPPDCSDPATLALVRQSLVDHFKVPASVTIEDIETHAGGYVAFRFACEADLHNINPNDLAPGTVIPGSVYYISRLSPDHRRHEVEVSLYPLLKLEKVQ